MEFPKYITERVVSEAATSHITLMNLDLEMAGVLLRYSVLEQIFPDLCHHQVVNGGCDNTPPVLWMQPIMVIKKSTALQWFTISFMVYH
jgi:hypothetical protein